MIHRDLKLGNLFLSKDMNLKLGDFGLAAKISYDGEKKRTICGTPNYIAPEVLSSRIGHSYEIDVWAIGVILYTSLFGRPPFETTDVKKTYKRIKLNNYAFPGHVKVDPNAKDLIAKILKSDPKERISLEDILAHEFMKDEIPKRMPVSTLSCPPSTAMLEQYGSVGGVITAEEVNTKGGVRNVPGPQRYKTKS